MVFIYVFVIEISCKIIYANGQLLGKKKRARNLEPYILRIETQVVKKNKWSRYCLIRIRDVIGLEPNFC